MDAEAARTARDSLELVFQMSNILETGLDRHTLSVLVALCDMGLNPESLAALVKELRTHSSPLPPPPPPPPPPQPLNQLNSGKVVAVGPGHRDRDGKLIPVSLKEGDTVRSDEYGGTEVKLGEKEFHLYSDDILGTLHD